jgi:predicted Holliday junction resolvase-like endonuclease
MVFLGKGCDYIIFDGLSEWNLREILFLELKSGNARLTKNEEALKNCIWAKKVRYAEYHIASHKSEERAR